MKESTTPEEVKDRKAKSLGFSNWRQLIIYSVHNSKQSDLERTEKEAMQEYHKQMVEQAGIELPTQQEALKYVACTILGHNDPKEGINSLVSAGEVCHRFYNWMKEQASLILAKKESDFQKLLVKHCSEYLDYEKKLQHKDKEIIELKKDRQHYHDVVFKKINTNKP